MWSTIVKFFPLFDYENNRPSYGISVKNVLNDSVIVMNYYDEGKAVWSEEEQEQADKILGYINGMVKTKEIDYDKAAHSNYFNISLSYFAIKRLYKYIWYDLYDRHGNCIVLYEGYDAIGDADPSLKGKPIWFAADPSFYNYLNSLLG